MASNTRAMDFNKKHPKGPILPLTLTSQYCSTINTGGCNVLLNSCPRLCFPHIALFVLHRGRNFCTCKASRNLFFFFKNTPLSVIWEDSWNTEIESFPRLRNHLEFSPLRDHKYETTNCFPTNIQIPFPSREVKLSLSTCTHSCTAPCQCGAFGGAWLQSLIRTETRCLPSCSLHLERTLAQSHWQQITGLEDKADPHTTVVCPTMEGADMTEQCLIFRLTKSLGYFVYFLRVLSSCPLCGFQHRKDNLKQQHKQRKPTVSEKKPALVIKDSACNTLSVFFKIPDFPWSDQ